MSSSDVITRAPEVYKAISAFLVSAGALEVAVQAVVVSSGIAPASWLQGLVAAGAAITGASTWWTRNKDSLDKITKTIEDNKTLAEQIIAEYKANN